MMDRVVPIGISFRGCGTIATRPEGLRNLQWLPFCDTKANPCASRIRMISSEPSRLGMNERFSDDGIAYRREIASGCTLEIKLYGLAQIRNGFLTRCAEAGNVNV